MLKRETRGSEKSLMSWAEPVACGRLHMDRAPHTDAIPFQRHHTLAQRSLYRVVVAVGLGSWELSEEGRQRSWPVLQQLRQAHAVAAWGLLLVVV